jgi:hypothetical protein
MENLLENLAEYDSEKDILESGGNWGIQLADAILRTNNYDIDKIKGWTFYRDYKQSEKIAG